MIRRNRAGRAVKLTLRHLVLAALSAFWLIPIVWLVATSLSTYKGINISKFFPDGYTIQNYVDVLTSTDSICNFGAWFKNTFIVAACNCVICSVFALSVAYSMSILRFKGRKTLMNIGVLLGLYPGFLSMIAVYFVLKSVGLTDSHFGLILVYSGSSGLGYLIAKGFFDTVSPSICEAARLEGASELRVFTNIILPLSKPIVVYTVINSFLSPWMDFVFANIIIKSRVSDNWTVAMGLYKMLDRSAINEYFSRFCAAGVLVSIPISVLFIIMQKFYVEGITGGASKG